MFDPLTDPLTDPFWFLAARRRLTGLRWRISFSTGDQYEMDIADDMVVFSDEEPAELEFHFVGKLQGQVKGSNPDKMDC